MSQASRISNTAGFSLIEGMIILTVLTTVVLSMGQIAAYNARAQTNTKVWEDINITIREVGSLLNRTEICDANFAGFTADGLSLQYFKYSMAGGLAATNIIANIGPSAAPYRDTKVRITEMTLLGPTQGPEVTSISTTTGDGTLYVRANFEFTGDQNQIAGTKSKTAYYKIYANFANIIPAAALPTGNATYDTLALTNNCASKVSVAGDVAVLDTNSPISNLLSPYNGTTMIMQDCKIIRPSSPTVAFCKPQTGIQ